MSASHWRGDWGLKRLPYLKYYNVLKRENGLTLRLNAAKNSAYMKKKFQIKVVENSIQSIFPLKRNIPTNV